MDDDATLARSRAHGDERTGTAVARVAGAPRRERADGVSRVSALV